MMRKALQLYEEYGEEIVFLDFSDGNFDESEVIKPRKPIVDSGNKHTRLL